jgi:hypothetical protein
MFRLASLLVTLVCGVALAQEVPTGTAIPVMLGSSLNTSKDSPGKKIKGEVMEEVRIGDDLIKERSRIYGRVVRVSHSKESGSSVAIVFDEIKTGGKVIPVKVFLIALASMTEVAWAQDPINTGANTWPENEWVTRQVGGDVVNRGRRLVFSQWGPSGKWVAGTGVRMKLTPVEGSGCPSGPGYNREQALWVFSSNACGAYGWKDLSIERGPASPAPEIILTSPRNINVRGGSGWLLMSVE